MTVANGESVRAYQANSVAYNYNCVSETRTCHNGVLDGAFAYANCVAGTPANCLWNNQTVLNGSSVTAYAAGTVAYGSNCQSQTRTCQNGTLSGNYTFSNCVVASPLSCIGPDGSTIQHGSSKNYYARS